MTRGSSRIAGAILAGGGRSRTGLDKIMLTYEQALNIVLANSARMPVIQTALTEATGRVLAEDIVSDVNMPPFDKSAMDGYAVRAQDVEKVPANLRVIDVIRAGYPSDKSVSAGECSKIMTGAPIPSGADAVVMVEDTEPLGDNRVRIRCGVSKGSNICPLGEEVLKDDVVVREATVLRPFEIALAAAAGRTTLHVYAAPQVAILATGDEIIEPGRMPRPGQIRNSNSPALVSRLRRIGIGADDLGIAPDESRALREHLQAGLTRNVLIITGGVSVGDYDLVPKLLADLGVTLLFEQIAVKPGRPTVLGKRDNTLVFGLPGNPVSTLLIAELLVVPALRRMMGEKDPLPPMQEAVLDEPVSHKPNRTSFRPVTVLWSGCTPHARPVKYHGSADLAGASRGDGFAAIPQGIAELPAGSTVRVLLFY